MRRLARVALIAVLLLRARPADDPAATAALARTRAPAEPDASFDRASRARAVVLSELAREMLRAAALRECRASDERPGRGLGGAIRHLAERTAFGRRRANQTFVGRVFLEGATIPRGGGASSVARARRAPHSTRAAPRPNQCVVGAAPKRQTVGARTVRRVGRLSQARARALPSLSLSYPAASRRARALSLSDFRGTRDAFPSRSRTCGPPS